RSDWFFEVGRDQHSSSLNPLFVDLDGADNLPGYTGGADHGLDDDFHLQPGSPAIDKGDPAAYFLSEPWPNGGRADIGAYGNTPEAAQSPTQLVQVLSPNGLEKYEASQQVITQWRSAGLLGTLPVALINAGGPAVGIWSAG